MTKTARNLLLAGAAAALVLVVTLSTLRRAQEAGTSSVTWDSVQDLVRAGGPGRALSFLDERLLSHPNDALLYYYRGRLRYEAGDAPSALRDADRAIALGYAQEVSHLLKAYVYGRLYGDWKRQAELAAKALSYDPTYSDAYLARAEARYALGDYAGCQKDAKAYTGMEPAAPDGWEYDLLCREARGDLAGAEAAGLKVLAIRPSSHAALWRLGRVHSAQGLRRRAIGEFSDAIRLSGGRAQYYMDRAAACAAEGDFACEAWDRAAAMDWPEISSYASYYVLLGAAMHRVGELERGLEAAEKAVSLSTAAPEARELRDRLRAESGRSAGARPRK